MLNDEWPVFLDLVQSNPREAATEFCKFALKLFAVSPPPSMRSLAKEDFENIRNEIVEECLLDNCATLRRYQRRGYPFAAWLKRIAENRSIDFKRKQSRAVHLDDGTLIAENDSPSNNPSRIAELSQAARIVVETLTKLDDKCRLLLKLTAHGYKPREIAKILGDEYGDAKKISGDRRYCRQKLEALIVQDGFDLGDIRA